MNIDERIQCLREIDLFSSFSAEDLQKFAENVSEVECADREILFQEGEEGREMFILLAGMLKVFKDNRVITVIHPVDYIGEMALIEEKPRSATVMVKGKSLLMKISVDQFQDVVRQPPSILTMMKTLSRRIRRDTELIAAEFEQANILIHDMKNIISPFLLLDSVKRKISDESLKGSIQTLQIARSNLIQMMEEALAQAKRLQRPLPFAMDSLEDLLEEMSVSEFIVHPDLQDKTVTITVANPLPDFLFCKLDVRRVVLNLVLNAAQASQAGDVVDIGLDVDGDQVVVAVRDQGIGVPKELGGRIFDSHFTTKPEGTGLGLASCKQVIEERHNGAMSYHSVPGEGSTFTFTLPLTHKD